MTTDEDAWARLEPPWEESRSRQYVMAAEDLVAVSAAILDRFPAARFLERSLSRQFDPGEEVAGPPEVKRLDTLADTDNAMVIWLEPDGWKPKWRYGRFQVQLPRWKGGAVEVVRVFPENAPEVRCIYQPASKYVGEPHILHEGMLWTFHRRTDAANRSFFGKVGRVFDRFCERAAVVDRLVDEPDGTVARRPIGGGMRFGRAALAWCAARPERRLDWSLRPNLAYEAQLRARGEL